MQGRRHQGFGQGRCPHRISVKQDMAVSKLANRKWQAQVLPNGSNGKRIRRQFATKGEAQLLFKPCYSAFRKAMQRAIIETPVGQLKHVLRHTFASHFMMNGGNILVLQRILGHTDIKLTMRYAHFAPDHLMEAISFIPLSLIDFQ